MDSRSYKTRYLSHKEVERKWVVVDAAGVPLGRLASRVALRLRGKHRPDFSPNIDCGDRVIIINADQVKLTGMKWQQKVFTYHTGYPGGQKQPSYNEVKQKNPAKVIEIAVKGMLPKNRMGRRLFTNLYVYPGAEHKHEAQNPETITLHT